MLKAGPGCKGIVNTNLVDDPRLTAENIRGFRKAYKELYDLYALSNSFDSISSFIQDVITDS
jgi:hypothetical protein